MINLILRDGELINLDANNSIHQDCFNELSSDFDMTPDEFGIEYSSLVETKYQQLADYGYCWINDVFYDCNEEAIANAIVSLSREELINILKGVR